VLDVFNFCIYLICAFDLFNERLPRSEMHGMDNLKKINFHVQKHSFFFSLSIIVLQQLIVVLS